MTTREIRDLAERLRTNARPPYPSPADLARASALLHGVASAMELGGDREDGVVEIVRRRHGRPVTEVPAEFVPTVEHAERWADYYRAMACGEDAGLPDEVPVFSEAFLYPIAGSKTDARFIGQVGREHDTLVKAVARIVDATG